jgi:hypothetical protein
MMTHRTLLVLSDCRIESAIGFSENDLLLNAGQRGGKRGEAGIPERVAASRPARRNSLERPRRINGSIQIEAAIRVGASRPISRIARESVLVANEFQAISNQGQ